MAKTVAQKVAPKVETVEGRDGKKKEKARVLLQEKNERDRICLELANKKIVFAQDKYLPPVSFPPLVKHSELTSASARCHTFLSFLKEPSLFSPIKTPWRSFQTRAGTPCVLMPPSGPICNT